MVYRKLVLGNAFGNIYFSIACGVYITGKRIVFRRSAKWNIDVYYAKDIQKTIRF